MKKILFATTAAGLVAFSGAASAQGVSVFGDGRLGLHYDDSRDQDELRATSRVRFGVNLTGETPTGITFGGTIRADNAQAGTGLFQSAGNIFVSGVYGTLTYGDTGGADRQHVGDITTVGLTDLDDLNETPHLTNARNQFGLSDLFGTTSTRPTVRYDYDLGTFGVPGLGFSASTDSNLNDIAVGLGYGLDLGGFGVDLGLGWARLDTDGTGPGALGQDNIDQWSATVGANGTGAFGDYGIKVTWSNVDEDIQIQTIGVGLTAGFGELGVQAYAHHLLDGDELFENSTIIGAGASYDLGGGAVLRGGWARDFDDRNIADLGIRLSF